MVLKKILLMQVFLNIIMCIKACDVMDYHYYNQTKMDGCPTYRDLENLETSAL